MWNPKPKKRTGTIGLFTGDSIALTAVGQPVLSAQSFIWRSSKASVASVDQNGVITAIKPGSATIYATAADQSGKSVSIKIKVSHRVESLSLENAVVAGGKKLTMKAMVYPANAANKKVDWSISGATGFASINPAGVLTTKKVTEPKVVIVTATAKDGSGVSASCVVTIHPETMSMDILDAGNNVVDGKTITIRKGETLSFSAIGTPENCAQKFSWKSSNAKYASVDENGNVIGIKAGTVTITATAADNSNEKATFKIKVLNEVYVP